MAKNLHENGAELSEEDIAYFLERMNSGEEVVAGSRAHRIMTATSEWAMRITSRMNAAFDSLSETRAQLEKLWRSPIPENMGLFPLLIGRNPVLGAMRRMHRWR